MQSYLAYEEPQKFQLIQKRIISEGILMIKLSDEDFKTATIKMLKQAQSTVETSAKNRKPQQIEAIKKN
jgi:hypothetical protein